jgi:RHS repeat-associated protein
LNVAHNLTGRTNLLKSVSRPLGATFNLEYQRSGNTYAQPQSRWVLSRVNLFDGHAGDGDATVGNEFRTTTTTYRYENGVYDRFEREFYGYQKVTEEHRDPASDALYRSVVREFRIDTFFTRGLLASELTQDAAGRPFTKIEHTYTLQGVAADTVFPQLTKTLRSFYEGVSPAAKTTSTEQQFDALGNVTQFIDRGDDSTTDDDVQADIAYSACIGTYIVGTPTKIVVTHNGAEMRHREADVDCSTGNVTEVRQFVAGGTAVTDLTYLPNGNLQSVTDPANLNGMRASEAYTYDSTVQGYVTSVTDNVGYTSTAAYNLKYGKPESETDINNNTTTRVYDKVGRLVSVTGPYDQGGATPTIRFEYHPDDMVPWALTRHFDPFRDPSGVHTIDTVVFVDGLKRVLQTKKSATIFTGADTPADDNRMIVSGRVTFDFVGRAIQKFYPVDEASGSPGVFNTAPDPDGVPPTVTEYDVLNRPTKVTQPDPTLVVTTAYGFGPDRNNVLQLETTVTDENGVQKSTFHDVRDVVTSIKEPQGIWTSYKYDPMKQLVEVKDDKGNLTTLTYDNLGRTTGVNNPDTGATQTVYDLASNRTAKITANLTAAKPITYNYDQVNRLTSIAYPTFPANNVTYTYGLPGAAANRAGRITLVQDQSGSEERFYGKLGEVTREVKTIVGFTGAPPNTYVTQSLFDTFGRLRTLTYPDGEVLTYQYDAGGLVKQASGVKGPFTYNYINRLEYDRFQQRAFLETGNGVRSQHTYAKATRRLQNLRSAAAGAAPFQNLDYTYDKVGNVLSLSNDVALPAPSQFGGPTSQSFQYDDLYRLTNAGGTFQSAPGKSNNYSLSLGYDTIHNVLSKTQTNNIVQPSGTSIPQQKTSYQFTYAFPTSPAPRPHAATHVDNRTFSYDSNGNQTGWTNDLNGTTRTIVWDDENRIQSVSDNGHEMNYKYDDKGERVLKRGPQGETAYVNQYFTIRNGAIGTKHVYADETRVVSKLVVKQPTVEEKDRFFYHPDQLGSTNFVTEATGALFEHLEYFPFGETWVQEASNTLLTPYLFTSKELDEETDLYYYGARYYDPRTSQFLSTDPLMHSDPDKATATPALLNLYAYVANNPLRYIDPTGETLKLIGTDTDIKESFAALQKLTDNTLTLKDNGIVDISPTVGLGTQINRLHGAALVWGLIFSEKTTRIAVDKEKSSGTEPVRAKDEKGPLDAYVHWNPTQSDEFITGTDKSSQAESLAGKDSYILLGHELVHADRVTKGLDRYAPAILSHKFKNSKGQMVKELVSEEEWFVVGYSWKDAKAQGLPATGVIPSAITENSLRHENGLAPRVAYQTKDQLQKRGDW